MGYPRIYFRSSSIVFRVDFVLDMWLCLNMDVGNFNRKIVFRGTLERVETKDIQWTLKQRQM